MARLVRAIQPFTSPQQRRTDIGMDHPHEAGDDDGNCSAGRGQGPAAPIAREPEAVERALRA